MRSLLVVISTAAFGAAPAFAGVSVEMGAPGFYGQIDVGGFPAPRLVFPDPVIIEQHVHVGPPIYLHVPPGHAKNWSKHCRQYDACGHRVYFVQDEWYDDVYVPAWREKHGGKKAGAGHGPGKGKGD
jgi:hypothetical protein